MADARGIGAAHGDAAVGTLVALRDAVVDRLPVIGVALVVAAAFYVLGLAGKRVVRYAGRHTRLDPMLADLAGTVTSGLMAVLGFLVALVIVFPTFKPGDLIAGLGITSVALGFAFKDILQNWLAGVFLLWRRPFVIGDQIRSGEHEGTVEEIRVRSTILRTYDGERVVVPNSDVYTRAIVVRTAYGRRRSRLEVGVAYEADVDRAREVVHAALAAVDGVLAEPVPWVYVDAFAASAVTLRVYYWTAPDQATVLRTRDRVAAAVKAGLDRAGIEIPYPHEVLVFPREVVSARRASPGAAPPDRPA